MNQHVFRVRQFEWTSIRCKQTPPGFIELPHRRRLSTQTPHQVVHQRNNFFRQYRFYQINICARTDSYVVFGKSTGSVIDLSAVAGGVGGFVINGQCSNDDSGWSVSAAGDVDGNGLADLIVGAYMADPNSSTLSNAGCSYVVFGKTTGTALTCRQWRAERAALWSTATVRRHSAAKRERSGRCER
jgi:FG-GAP repeat